MGEAGNEVKEKEKISFSSGVNNCSLPVITNTFKLSWLYTYLEVSKKEVTNYIDNVWVFPK